ncbi:MAG: tRNA (adenosine(37)-N6)-threonylcarbamoyltransferase complex dimerization subunit type 1 TsaB [Erysipelotrichaceae bacterium]|nr:tRNA (adenosine(37)-N6)-threonylcarbamoyltransferase complex dimerization subunit type 1 TsaB [Erysipelotrichaceae bacterium]
MYALGMDTSHAFLVICLMKDDKVIDAVQMFGRLRQSQLLVMEVRKMFDRQNLAAKDIDALVVTRGPGSYTGVRIAMTFAKVLASVGEKKLYTLSTLQLYAGLEDCYSIIDARAKRVYVGRYKDGRPLMEDTIYTNDKMKEIVSDGTKVVGDLHLFGREDAYGDLCRNFVLLRDQWTPVENVDLLAPSYLKSNEEYL